MKPYSWVPWARTYSHSRSRFSKQVLNAALTRADVSGESDAGPGSALCHVRGLHKNALRAIPYSRDGQGTAEVTRGRRAPFSHNFAKRRVLLLRFIIVRASSWSRTCGTLTVTLRLCRRWDESNYKLRFPDADGQVSFMLTRNERGRSVHRQYKVGDSLCVGKHTHA
jgi:hypothetical protein